MFVKMLWTCIEKSYIIFRITFFAGHSCIVLTTVTSVTEVILNFPQLIVKLENSVLLCSVQFHTLFEKATVVRKLPPHGVKSKRSAVAALVENVRESCEFPSLVEHLRLSPWLFLIISGTFSHSSSPNPINIIIFSCSYQYRRHSLQFH